MPFLILTTETRRLTFLPDWESERQSCILRFLSAFRDSSGSVNLVPATRGRLSLPGVVLILVP